MRAHDAWAVEVTTRAGPLLGDEAAAGFGGRAGSWGVYPAPISVTGVFGREMRRDKRRTGDWPFAP